MRRGVPGRLAIFFALTMPAATVAAPPVGLSPERVREAIQWGLAAPEPELAQYEMKTDRTWLVNFDTPFLRVAQLARSMKVQNTPFTAEDVPPRTTADEVHVYAHARPEGATQRGPSLPNIEHVLIVRTREDGAGTEPLSPLSVQSFVRRVPMGDDWSGPTRIARSVKAVFPLHVLAPGNDVRLVFESGETQTVRITAEMLSRVR
jgi:hypothetical protein